MRVARVASPHGYVGRRIMLEVPGAMRFRTITAAVEDGEVTLPVVEVGE